MKVKTEIKSNYLIVLIKEFLKFIVNPNLNTFQQKNRFRKFIELTVLLIIEIIITIVLGVLVSNIIDSKNTMLEQFFKTYTPLIIFSLGAIVVPIFEELSFRLSILYKPINFSLSISIICFYIF